MILNSLKRGLLAELYLRQASSVLAHLVVNDTVPTPQAIRALVTEHYSGLVNIKHQAGIIGAAILLLLDQREGKSLEDILNDIATNSPLGPSASSLLFLNHLQAINNR
ncbi:MAG: hypothetical protein M3Y50_12835 [Acidobacteriota bacterium]|nr:hypothetical protein [Acidobacteriota bacterium]